MVWVIISDAQCHKLEVYACTVCVCVFVFHAFLICPENVSLQIEIWLLFLKQFYSKCWKYPLCSWVIAIAKFFNYASVWKTHKDFHCNRCFLSSWGNFVMNELLLNLNTLPIFSQTMHFYWKPHKWQYLLCEHSCFLLDAPATGHLVWSSRRGAGSAEEWQDEGQGAPQGGRGTAGHHGRGALRSSGQSGQEDYRLGTGGEDADLWVALLPTCLSDLWISYWVLEELRCFQQCIFKSMLMATPIVDLLRFSELVLLGFTELVENYVIRTDNFLFILKLQRCLCRGCGVLYLYYYFPFNCTPEVC